MGLLKSDNCKVARLQTYSETLVPGLPPDAVKRPHCQGVDGS